MYTSVSHLCTVIVHKCFTSFIHKFVLYIYLDKTSKNPSTNCTGINMQNTRIIAILMLLCGLQITCKLLANYFVNSLCHFAIQLHSYSLSSSSGLSTQTISDQSISEYKKNKSINLNSPS